MEKSLLVEDTVLVPEMSNPGLIEVTGHEALDLLHRLSTNNLLKIGIGQASFTVFVTDKGRVIDQVIVLREANRLLLFVSQGNEESLVSWLMKYTIMEDVHYRILTSHCPCSLVVGREAFARCESLLKASIPGGIAIDCQTPFIEVTAVGVEKFGLQWVYLLFGNGGSRQGIDVMLEGAISILTEGEWEAFRIWHGVPVHGRELSEDFNPYEVGLRDVISFTKGCYVGQEVIARLDTYQKIQKQLVGVVLHGRFSLSLPAPIFIEGKEIGILTSVAPIGLGGHVVGLAVVRKDIPIGERVFLSMPERQEIESRFVLLPFSLDMMTSNEATAS